MPYDTGTICSMARLISAQETPCPARTATEFLCTLDALAGPNLGSPDAARNCGKTQPVMCLVHMHEDALDSHRAGWECLSVGPPRPCGSRNMLVVACGNVLCFHSPTSQFVEPVCQQAAIPSTGLLPAALVSGLALPAQALAWHSSSKGPIGKAPTNDGLRLSCF